MPEPAPGDPGKDEASRDDAEGLAPFLLDPSLWPITAVAVAIFIVFGAAGLLLAFAERNLFAIAAVMLAFWISVDASLRERRRAGRFSRIAGLAVGLWLASAACAVAVHHAGWF